VLTVGPFKPVKVAGMDHVVISQGKLWVENPPGKKK
jgi:hypothetical protein